MKFQFMGSGSLALTILLTTTFPYSTSSYSFTPPTRSNNKVGPSSSTKIQPWSIPTSVSSHNNNRRSRNGLVMTEGTKKPFSINSLFGKSSTPKKQDVTPPSPPSPPSPPTTATTTSTTTSSHPSALPHISPLNLLHPSLTTTPSSSSSSSPPLPRHPSIVSGTLPTGLSYLILPNKSPPGRFEAHLQVFSGSADELQQQQGIAHLTEHVAYMGSRKRERLFGTGSQTNAYTDFHHTVFYAACPCTTPGGPRGQPTPMLPMALDALCDVMEAKVEHSRLEKERQAVLSEMTMVNTIEYRVECQILSTLHRENRLAKRFPIGKESLIQSWTREDVKLWHRTHYRPDNVLLYVVGDVDPMEVERCIAEKFGHVTADKLAKDMGGVDDKSNAKNLMEAIVEGKDVVSARQSWHYPPVRHDFNYVPGEEKGELEMMLQSGGNGGDGTVNGYDIHLQDSYEMDEEVDILKTELLAPGKKIRPHIFRHELLQAFSLHLFAKRTVEPITDLATFRRSLARRVALAALQIRLNVGGRSDDPAFTFVEFNQLDSAREGCAVCSLDMTAEPHRWKDAVCKALSEVRKLGVYGVTNGELERYASALMTDAEQLAAQGDRISNGDQLAHLMETVANGHSFMSPEQSYGVTVEALKTLDLEEVNEAARELCSHITSINDAEKAVEGFLIATACCPKNEKIEKGDDAYCDEELLVKTIYEACQIPVEPEEDVSVPHTLVPEEVLNEAAAKYPGEWQGGSFSDGTPNTPADKLTRPFTLRRFSNGMRIGVARNEAESQRGHLRLTAPGGRHAEVALGFPSGSMAVGARAMQEGGAFGPWTREQVELFCVDHLLMVEINCIEESLVFDFVFPTTNVGNVGFGDEVKLGITGTEAVMQIVREIIVGFHWEEDALGRSKQSFRSAHEGLQKNLEGKSTEVIMEAMTGHDERFLSVDVDTVNSVTLDEARSAVMSQLHPSNLEVSIAGDFNAQEVLDMCLKYLGTIPEDANSEYLTVAQKTQPKVTFGNVPKLELPGRFLELELTDSDPRAVAYVAGAAPNMWGYMADGTNVAQRVMEADKKRAKEGDTQRRSHPLFANVALSLLSEIINRRLFSTVRERKQLTYDANFSLTGFERLAGGWFLVTVTASKEKAQRALDACKETLEALRKSSPVTVDNLESAKRVVMNRHEGELRASSYWTTLMTGLQEESVPLKGPLSVTDYNAMVAAITTQDLQLTLECLGLDDAELYTAIGKTIQPEGFVPDDDLISVSPMAGMGRGGALTG